MSRDLRFDRSLKIENVVSNPISGQEALCYEQHEQNNKMLLKKCTIFGATRAILF